MGRRLRGVVAAATVIAAATTGVAAVPTPATAVGPDARGPVRLAEEPGAVAWIYPVPLDAAVGDQDRWRRVQRPRQRLVFPLMTDVRYQVRKARWRNWGGRTVRVRGEVRLCWSHCTDWHPGAIVLGGRRDVECSGEQAVRYTRFRLRGFAGLAGGVYRARASC